MERKTKTHPHAVATKTVDATRSNSYSYDALGNMVTRNYWQPDLATTSWVQHNQALQYNPENKLTSVQEGGATIASFVYDGTGSRVLGTVNGETIAYVGTHYEVNVTSGAVTKYYGGNALKKNGNLQYLFKDHLGSVVGSLDANSGVIESQRAYKPFGDDLLMRGTIPTTLGYTGQRQEPELGLYYYNARWYDPYLARFTQPDTIVPNPTDAKAFDRYAYVYNNPVMYSDPSGHCVESNGQETGQGGVGYACPGSTWKKTDPIISSGNSDGGTETSVEPDATQGGGEGWVIYGPPPPPLPTPVIIEPDKIKIVTKVELNLDPNYQHPEDVSGPSHPIADLTGLLLQAADWSCNVLNQLCPPRGRTGLVTVSLIIDRSGPGSDRAMGVEVNNYAMNSLGINVFTEYGDSYGYESLNVGERAYFDVPNTPLATLSDIHVRIGNGRIEETVGAKIPLPEALNTSLVGTTVVPYFDQPVLLPADYQWR